MIEANLEKRSQANRKAVRDRFERQLEGDFELDQFCRYSWPARAVFTKVRDFWS
ncbi:MULTISPECIES: hypothetical protein [Primorskyibacter]|uniref:hypothetical protein n=1 Tax=Primorskyibacter TaxID=1068904 RepID=UPI0013008EF1|nr:MULTISPECIES: hypothetical protein [Primorskyibacter]